MSNLPVRGPFIVTAIYGQKGPLWGKGHQGIDLVAENRNIYSPCKGKVRVVAFDEGGWGQYLSIGDDSGQRHILCHLVPGSVKVKAGDQVDPSMILGTMGASGNVTGTHLHYQLQQGEKVIDPTSWLGIPNQLGKYDNLEESLMFKDEKSIPEWALKAVEEAVEKGLMKGDTEGTFRPNDPVTRAELAVILSRLK